MNKVSLPIFLMLFVYGSYAQTVFYSSIEDINFVGIDSTKVQIGVFNVLTCEKQVLFTDTIIFNQPPLLEWLDLAICPDGKLYGTTHDGLYNINISAGNYNKLIDPNPPIRYFDSGIHCTKDSVLVFGERDLGSYDLRTGILTYYGRLPTSKSIWSNIFSMGNKLFASGGNNIIELNLMDVDSSRIICSFPPGIGGFHAIYEVAVTCDSSIMVAFNGDGNLSIIDTTNCSQTFLCSLPKGVHETFQGSAANYMFMAPPPCTIHIDLDSLDMSIVGIDVQDTVLCHLPGEFLFAEIDMSSDRPWDSLYAWIEESPPDIVMNAVAIPGTTTTGQLTMQIRFIADDDSIELEEVLSSLYQIQLVGTVPPGFSQVKIGFRLFADHLRSDTAYAYITLIGRTTFAGMDGEMLFLCPDETPIALDDLLSIDATLGGDWFPMTSNTGFFNPETDSATTYVYMVPDPFCPPDTAAFDIQTFSHTYLNLGPDRELCRGDTIRLNITNPDVSSIIWSTGYTSTSIFVDTPQDVYVDIIDINGCLYTDSIRILPDIGCLSQSLYIPNIFSPDGNGLNDRFSITPVHEVDRLEFTVFDRWGDAIYFEQGPAIDWDGLVREGKPVASGVYVYRLVITIDGVSVLRQGDITVIR